MLRSGWLFCVLSFSLITASAPSVQAASGCSPRAPQIAFNSAALQSYLTANDGGINVLTDQLNDQCLTIPLTTGTFSLAVKFVLSQASIRIGIYGAPDLTSAPTRYEIFADSSQVGWYAICQFTAAGRLNVSVFDENGVNQSGSTYGGFDRTVVGWYLQSASGIYYSQDARDGGRAQTLTYAGTGPYTYDVWECLEAAPYNAGTSTFTGAVLDVETPDPWIINPCITPVPVHASTWGRLKAIYR